MSRWVYFNFCIIRMKLYPLHNVYVSHTHIHTHTHTHIYVWISKNQYIFVEFANLFAYVCTYFHVYINLRTYLSQSLRIYEHLSSSCGERHIPTHTRSPCLSVCLSLSISEPRSPGPLANTHYYANPPIDILVTLCLWPWRSESNPRSIHTKMVFNVYLLNTPIYKVHI